MKKIPVFPFTIQNKGGNSAEKIPASESRSDYNFVKKRLGAAEISTNRSVGNSWLAATLLAKKNSSGRNTNSFEFFLKKDKIPKAMQVGRKKKRRRWWHHSRTCLFQVRAYHERTGGLDGEKQLRFLWWWPSDQIHFITQEHRCTTWTRVAILINFGRLLTFDILFSTKLSLRTQKLICVYKTTIYILLNNLRTWKRFL